MLLGYLALFVPTLALGQKPNPKTVVISFGGECKGTKYPFSASLKKLIQKQKKQTGQLCDDDFCDGAFAYDLNGDGRKEYFIRLSCGGTGNCTYGIFSDRTAKLQGTFTAWFFYIHKRKGTWSKITTYTREGGDQGVIASLEYRGRKYVQTAERTEHGYFEHPQPFMELMEGPDCS